MKFKAFFQVIFTISVLGLFLCLLDQKSVFRPKLAVLGPQKDEISIVSTVKDLASQGICVADTLKADLGQKYAILLQKVRNAYPSISQNTWQKTFDMIDTIISQDTLLTKNPVIKHKKGDHKLVKMAREILASCNIDPARVTIRTINKNERKSNAATFQGYLDDAVLHELELNIPQLETHTTDIQKAIIRHEVVHMLHYDPLMRSAIHVMLQENGISEAQYMKEPALLELYQYQEFRADLSAACHSIDTAYSLQKDLEMYMKTYPQDPADCITHPTDTARHQAVTQLIGYLEAENKIKLA